MSAGQGPETSRTGRHARRAPQQSTMYDRLIPLVMILLGVLLIVILGFALAVLLGYVPLH